MRKVVVTGSSGQLGKCLQAVIKEKNIGGYVFLKREQADILNQESLKAAFDLYNPIYCINCAAYTAVDKAEDEPEVAQKINKDGVANLGMICNEYGATLIHVSTDFVFSGEGSIPLSESDATTPVNSYGVTKLAGEQAIPEYTDKFFIIRTSWLYSEFGNNFVKTMLRLAKEKKELRVVWDQLGTPTYARDLATCITEMVASDSKLYGIYHYSNEGVTSWYDFAKSIFELSSSRLKVIPVRTSEYPLKAKRPPNSVLDKSKIKRNFDIKIPYWRESLKSCINRL
jgi:dTDP-4-dehydrorhamnose reductase